MILCTKNEELLNKQIFFITIDLYSISDAVPFHNNATFIQLKATNIET